MIVLVGEFTFPDVFRKYSAAERRRCRKLLECVQDDFVVQVVSEPAGEGAPLALLFADREGLVGDVVVGGSLGISDHDILGFGLW